MGKQSARMIYRGKDHKDIYFRGKYHDAMYLGYELLWHKIRKEGYYVLIYNRGESYAEDKMIVSVFDEKTKSVEKVLEVEKDQYSDAYYVDFMNTMDDERIYMSTLGTDALIASSTDGIHYENTNLDYFENKDMFTFGRNYFSYLTKLEEKVFERINCIWGLTNYEGLSSTFIISKSTIKIENKKYLVESKNIDTKLSMRSVRFTNYRESNYLRTPLRGKIALHIREIVHFPLTEKEIDETTVKYFDVETETSGEISIFEGDLYNKFSVLLFACINGIYVIFVEHTKYKGQGLLYVYYSFDGINYENSLMSKRVEGQNSPYPFFVLYRSGIYYIYCNSETSETGAPRTLFLTTDFKHFSKKYIPSEIEVGGETFLIGTELTPFDAYSSNSINFFKNRYFYNGEVAYPEDGILAHYKGKYIYIDNMFFRESSENKILTFP